MRELGAMGGCSSTVKAVQINASEIDLSHFSVERTLGRVSDGDWGGCLAVARQASA